MVKDDKGLLIVLSGPAGVGKGTVCRALRKIDTNIAYSVSATTRPPREGEVDGVDYFFKSKEEFRKMIERNELLEWAQYVDNYYGTPLQFVKDTIAKGKDIILEIEVQGAKKVKEKYPEGVFIFLMPPSLEELRERIVERGTETKDLIEKRMNVAQKEIDMMKNYDYVVENDEVDAAVKRIQAIVTAEHLKRERLMDKYKRLVEVE
ncbi:guanylate kinase [Aliibacillus thermotolerans]|uniref:Guanylate kinase n=1 Tax=Aliibacillus thermotolerans TaxID=1834418 RepID=A0ABW0U4X9_9BACI|nr:guanylate kinase [Aliibacillus thermotolerans]MDA3130668.1 guanylate kinase [Aliibacillus thermotolerans]